MNQAPNQSPQQDAEFQTYTTHRIPWYVHVMWIAFGIGLIWYVFRFAIPSAKSFL